MSGVRDGINQTPVERNVKRTWDVWYRGDRVGYAATEDGARARWVEAHRAHLLNDERKRLTRILGSPGRPVPDSFDGEEETD